MGRAPVLCPGRLRPRQPLLPRLGSDLARCRRNGSMAARVGVRPRRPAGVRPKAGPRAAGGASAGLGALGRGGLRGVRMRARRGSPSRATSSELDPSNPNTPGGRFAPDEHFGFEFGFELLAAAYCGVESVRIRSNRKPRPAFFAVSRRPDVPKSHIRGAPVARAGLNTKSDYEIGKQESRAEDGR